MKDCPLTNTSHSKCGLQAEDCEFKHTCQAMLEDENRALLQQLKEADRNIMYYEAAEDGNDYAKEAVARKQAYASRAAILAECARRGLKWQD